jgi:hypothetical protein
MTLIFLFLIFHTTEHRQLLIDEGALHQAAAKTGQTP